MRDERAPPFPMIPHTFVLCARSIRTALLSTGIFSPPLARRDPTHFARISLLQAVTPSLGRHPRRPRALALRDRDDKGSHGRDHHAQIETNTRVHPQRCASLPARAPLRPRRGASLDHPWNPFHASEAGGYACARALPHSRARSLHASSRADRCPPLGRDCAPSSSSTTTIKGSFGIYASARACRCAARWRAASG